MPNDEQQGTAGSGGVGASGTIDPAQRCDYVSASTGNPCHAPARWRIVLWMTGRIILFRCDEHCRKLEQKYGSDPTVMEKEPINRTW